ncbi:MAG: SDR family NAD(P)-dependent oxidoreductase [Burkholderiales bacterium]
MTTALFEGQVVVVAGGGGGLGRQYCLDLGRAGARVVVGGRSATAEAVAAEIIQAGGQALACVADVRDGARLIETALDGYGRLDGLIVNAGIVRDKSFAKLTVDDWREVMSITVDGAFACSQAAWPHLLAQRAGRIVLTSSGAALHGNFGQANYAAAKGAVIGLMRTLALEGASKNVFTNAVAPMATTPMTEAVFDERLKQALTAEAVSPYVLALAHPTCRENGAVIEAGGGWAAKVRWQRAAGIRLDAQSLDAAQVLARWDDVTGFDGEVTYPTTTLDCLRTASGL